MNKTLNIFLLTTSMFVSTLALADSPVDINTPDSHSYETKGVIDLYRVQIQGLELGKNRNKLDAEILVKLDSDPEKVYGVRLHENSPPVNSVLADTLRVAFLKKIPVTLYYQKVPGVNVKINMVQLNYK